MTYQQNTDHCHDWPSNTTNILEQLVAVRVRGDQEGRTATADGDLPSMKRSSRYSPTGKPTSISLRINDVTRDPEHSTPNVNQDLGDATPTAKWEGYSAPPLLAAAEKTAGPPVFYPYQAWKDVRNVTPRATKVAFGSAPRFHSALSPNAAASACHPKNQTEDSIAGPDPKQLDNFVGALLTRENSKLATTPVKSGPRAPPDRLNGEISEKELANDMLRLIREGKTFQIPPPGYVCHICFAVGSHFISDCPEKGLSDSETPYEGRGRCFGYFQCKSCKKKWTSESSFSRMSQRCFKCHLPNFPYKQLKLDKARELGLTKDKKKPSFLGSHGSYWNATQWEETPSLSNTTASSVGFPFSVGYWKKGA